MKKKNSSISLERNLDYDRHKFRELNEDQLTLFDNARNKRLAGI